MKIAIKLEKEHWRAFNSYLCKKLAENNKTVFDNFLVNIIIWMVLGFSILFTLKMFGGIHWPTALLTSLVFVFIGLVLFYKNRAFQKAFEPMDNGSFCAEHSYQFLETGILTEDGAIPWSKIILVERAQGMILLYLDTAFALIFPEDKLEHPDEFYDLVIAKTSQSLGLC